MHIESLRLVTLDSHMLLRVFITGLITLLKLWKLELVDSSRGRGQVTYKWIGLGIGS